MRAVAWAALAVVGASFAIAPAATAMPLNPGPLSVSPEQMSSVVQVDRSGERRSGSFASNRHQSWGHNKRWRHKHRDRDNDFGFAFGLGLPLLGYGLNSFNDGPECIGRWHRHYSGRLHCHGRLVY